MDLSDIPGWITTHFPGSRNMGGLAQGLGAVVDQISPYVEESFCSNHIKSKEVLDTSVHAKSFWEGMWHLHVLWCMRTHGLKLLNPEAVGSSDDGVVVYDGERIGIEATFTNWGDPRGPLASTFRKRAFWENEYNAIDQNVADQVSRALAAKERKLAKRQPQLPRFVALNEVLATSGFSEWVTDTDGRRSMVVQRLQAQQLTGISGITYDFIGYGNFFRDPKLTLISLGPDAGKYRALTTLLGQ
jgi:hypothetical protein